MKVHMMGPFIAGLDTAAASCAFMLYALLKHPDVLAEMRKEADELFRDRTPTIERVRTLDVTHRVAMETLRMYPIAPAVFRTATDSFEFGGYTIPAGSKVIIGITVPHYLPEYFPDPRAVRHRPVHPRAQRAHTAGHIRPVQPGVAPLPGFRLCRVPDRDHDGGDRPLRRRGARPSRLRSPHHLRADTEAQQALQVPRNPPPLTSAARVVLSPRLGLPAAFQEVFPCCSKGA